MKEVQQTLVAILVFSIFIFLNGCNMNAKLARIDNNLVWIEKYEREKR